MGQDILQPEGLPNYVVPPPSVLDASEQHVVNAIVPEERQEEEDEPQTDMMRKS